MKNIFKLIIIAAITSILFASCDNNKTQNSDNNKNNDSQTENNSVQNNTSEKLIITDKIMYDVTVVNDIIGDRTKNSPDWFWENLPSPNGDEYLKNLFLDAVSGKLKTYYYDITGDYESFDEIPAADLKPYMDEVLTYEIEIIDTTVMRFKPEQVDIHLDYRNIKKLRFLEEWYMQDGKFRKEVIAVAPYFTIEYPDMETVHSVYFWILLNN
jgi:hypothetical protein